MQRHQRHEDARHQRVEAKVENLRAHLVDLVRRHATRGELRCEALGAREEPELGIADQIFSVPAVMVTATSQPSGISVTNA